MTETRVGISAVPSPGTSAQVRRNAAVMYRIGGRSYPMKTVATCKVCQSVDHRVNIERMLLHGYGPTAVHRSLPDDVQQALSIRNIMDHSRKHLPHDLVLRNAMIEARAREVGVDYENAEQSLVDGFVFARIGLQKVYERMIDGEITPGMSDGIAFAQMLVKAEEASGGSEGLNEEMYARGFMSYMRAIQRVCTPDQIRQIGAILQEDAVLQALLRAGERAEQQEVIEIPATPA